MASGNKQDLRGALIGLNREARLVAGLDVLSPKNLRKHPPKDDDRMGNDLLIGSGKCDRLLRPWINRDFRKPRNLPPLPRGKIKTLTTYVKLKGLADI